jgi:hypothetical protein
MTSVVRLATSAVIRDTHAVGALPMRILLVDASGTIVDQWVRSS